MNKIYGCKNRIAFKKEFINRTSKLKMKSKQIYKRKNGNSKYRKVETHFESDNFNTITTTNEELLLV